jgi:hypothetical protein
VKRHQLRLATLRELVYFTSAGLLVDSNRKLFARAAGEAVPVFDDHCNYSGPDDDKTIAMLPPYAHDLVYCFSEKLTGMTYNPNPLHDAAVCIPQAQLRMAYAVLVRHGYSIGAVVNRYELELRLGYMQAVPKRDHLHFTHYYIHGVDKRAKLMLMMPGECEMLLQQHTDSLWPCEMKRDVTVSSRTVWRLLLEAVNVGAAVHAARCRLAVLAPILFP